MNGLLKKIITILLVITMLAAAPAASACKGKSNTGSVTEPEKPEPGKPDPDEPEKPDPEKPDPDNPEPSEEPKFSDNTYAVTLSDKVVRNYLAAETDEEEFDIISANLNTSHDTQATLTITSKGSAYSLRYADNDKLENSRELRVNSDGKFIFGGTLIPDTVYYYEIADNGGKATERGTITTDKTFLRNINVAGARNIRDLGGWTTENNDKVVYGKIYRGAKLNLRNGNPGITDAGKKTMREDLGIKTEIDLRGSDDGGQTECEFDPTANYYKIPLNQYDPALTGSKEAFRRIFDVLADENNYPIYFHCNAGADRTGTLAYLISGLLGVSYRNLTKDFELTSFGGQGPRLRSAIKSDASGFDDTGVYQNDKSNYVAWGKLNKAMQSYTGETLADKIENYLLSAGVTQNQINTVRAIMLDPDELKDDPLSQAATCTQSGVKVYNFAGRKMTVTSPAVGHDFNVANGVATCNNCKKTAEYLPIDTDVETGVSLSFAQNITSVTDLYGKAADGLTDGRLSYTKSDASDKPRQYLVTADGKDTLLEVTVYGKMITGQTDLLSLNDYLVANDYEKAYYGYFMLCSDITLTEEWSKEYSIGYGGNEYVFKGVFDGRNHKITNFVTLADGALIYRLGSGGTIKNLTLKGEAKETKSQFLCANAFGGRIENVDVEAAFASWKDNKQTCENSLLLGKIGSANAEIDKIYIVNTVAADPTATGIKNYNLSCALGKIYSPNAKTNIYFDGLAVIGIRGLATDGSSNKCTVANASEWFGANAKNVHPYATRSAYEASLQ